MERIRQLAGQVSYSGNPEHKRNPGDFNLSPPSSPRKGKTLCDAAGLFTRAEALRLLREGLGTGLISDREIDGWPKNIWAVRSDGRVFEAQYERAGVYHGYPLPAQDPLLQEILETWQRRTNN